jgi:hypothetical protein
MNTQYGGYAEFIKISHSGDALQVFEQLLAEEEFDSVAVRAVLQALKDAIITIAPLDAPKAPASGFIAPDGTLGLFWFFNRCKSIVFLVLIPYWKKEDFFQKLRDIFSFCGII